VVHRAHLHEGLVKIAEKHGAKLLINSRVSKIEYTSSEKVHVTTEAGKQHTFDLLIGSDGVKSVVRKTLFPDVKPAPPTTNCAYRAIVPYEQIRKDPISRELIEKLTMEVWMSDKSYIISYPISAGKDFNMVLSHHVDRLVEEVEDVDMNDLRKQYENYEPRIKRIIDMIPEAQRWPLLVTGPLKSWSSPSKNVVLIGDAAHSMTNHMAQGAATSMEDGAFLGRCIGQVVQKRISLQQAISIYEQHRMPKAYFKQQVSFLNGAIWHLPDGPAQQARDNAMKWELEEKPFLRSPNLYGDPTTVLAVYAYDAEDHADSAIFEYFKGREPMDEKMKITKGVADTYMNWFLPEDYEGKQIRINSKL
jgi:salicylate hydroxylase